MKTAKIDTPIAAPAQAPIKPPKDTSRPAKSSGKRLFLVAVTVLGVAAPFAGEYVRAKEDDMLRAYSEILAGAGMTASGDPVRNHELKILDKLNNYVDRQDFLEDHRTNRGLLFSAVGSIGALILGYQALNENRRR